MSKKEGKKKTNYFFLLFSFFPKKNIPGHPAISFTALRSICSLPSPPTADNSISSSPPSPLSFSPFSMSHSPPPLQIVQGASFRLLKLGLGFQRRSCSLRRERRPSSDPRRLRHPTDPVDPSSGRRPPRDLISWGNGAVAPGVWGGACFPPVGRF